MLKKNTTFALLAFGLFLLLCTPLVALIFNWRWAPIEQTPIYLYPIYLVTETGTIPFVFLTCILLSAIPLLYLKLSLKKAFLLVVIFAATIAAGQVVKFVVKTGLEEPRPFVVWLDKTGYIQQQEFYGLNRAQRAHFLQTQDFSAHAIPEWHQKHWTKETGYSFPSGHSMFVAQWLFIYLLLLWRKRAYLPITLVALWAITVEASRLLLGMHWISDIVTSCLIASLLVYLASLFWDRWIFQPPTQTP